MDYLVLFENGSDAYLSHSGVKGMKWGVWNAETKARRVGNKRKRLTENVQKAEQKMMGAAHREANHKTNLHTLQLERAADKYITKRAKLNEFEKKHGKQDDPYGIREQERSAGKYIKGRNAAGILGGALGAAAYNATTKNKKHFYNYNEYKSRTLRDAREQAEYGRKQTLKLLELSEQGKVVGGSFDGKGNSFYVVKP